MLYENKHFRNCKCLSLYLVNLIIFYLVLGDLLSKKASTTKLEKFFTNQVRDKLKEISTDMQIANSFNRINQKIQDRLNKLRNTKFEPKEDDLENDKEN